MHFILALKNNNNNNNMKHKYSADKLPKYARPKKPWVRQGIFDYSILDKVGSGKRAQAPRSAAAEGNNTPNTEIRNNKAANKIQPKAAVQAFNPYENLMKDDVPTLSTSASGSKSNNKPSSPKPAKSLYQQQKEAQANKNKSSVNVMKPPPSFGSANVGAAPPKFGAAPQKGGGPPPVPPVPPQGGGGGPPPVPPKPPAPPQ